MSKCELRIALDRAEPVYHPGESITGSVFLRGDGGARVRRVTVAREWRTSGKGNASRGGKEEIVIGEDVPVQPTSEAELRFELPAPDGPPNYDGTLIRIEWVLRAEADVAWARDANAELPFRLALRQTSSGQPGEPYIRAVAVADLPAQARDHLDSVADASITVGVPQVNLPRPVVWGCLGCFGVVFVIPLIGTAIASLAAVLRGDLSGPFGLLVAGVFLGIPAAIIGFFYRHKLAERRLGKTTLKLSSQSLRPGEPVQFFVRAAPARDTEINGVRAVLRAQEVAVSGSGKSESTHRHTALERTAALGSASLRSGEDMVFAGRIDVPHDAPHSFRAASNRVEWRLQVEIDVQGWPNWKRTVPVEVKP